MTQTWLISASNSLLLVIDVQEKLLRLIPQRRRLLRNIAFLADAARALSVPVEATEQYPKGLGPTVSELSARIANRMAKVQFSGAAVPEVRERLEKLGRRQVVLAGIETHVCVMQTALDLLASDRAVYVCADAVGSRYVEDHECALRRLERAGVTVTTSEAAVFEWCGAAGTPEFKEVSRLVQDRMRDLSMPPSADS